MFLWWGPALVQLYNDGYRPSLGAGRHPAALGAPGRAFWADAWPAIGPDIEHIRAGGSAVWYEDRLVPIERDGRLEDVYWTYGYTPVPDDAGRVAGVLVTVVETTAQVRARAAETERRLAESEAARAALGAANTRLAAANAQLQDRQTELESANQQLQEQAVELEAQAEELQSTAAHLEEQTEAADRARAAADVERARTVSVLETMADAYFVLDAEFRIVAVNAAMERSTGLARPALLGRSMWDAFPGTVGNAFERAYRRAATEGAEAHFVHDYSDGRLELVTEVDVYPGPGGGVAVFWRDVTARVRAETALAAGDARYRALVASLDTGFCVIEVLYDDAGRAVDYRCLEANPTFWRQSGLPPDMVGRRIREVAPDLEAHWFRTFGRVARTGEPARFENYAAQLGRWFEVFAFRVDAPDRRRVAVLFTDVTAAKAAERERLLAESQAARREPAPSARRRACITRRLSIVLRRRSIVRPPCNA